MPSKSVNPELPPPAARTLDGSRVKISSMFDIRRIQCMEKSELLQLQTHLGLGSNWGIIEFPQTWMPPGKYQTEHNRIYDLVARAKASDLAPDDILLIQILATRFVCLFLLVPYGKSYAKASSAASRLGYWLLIAKDACRLPPRNPSLLFDRFEKQGVREIESNANKKIVTAKLAYWSKKNLSNDRLGDEKDSGLVERDWQGSRPESVARSNPRDPYQPLSDEYIAEAGWRVLWVIEELAPALMKCARGIIAIQRNANDRKMSKQWALKESNKYLERYRWLSGSGAEITRLEFEIKISAVGTPLAWPPRYSRSIHDLLLLLMSCHLHAFLLSTGGRIGECLSLQEGCVKEDNDGIPLANGRTYKLVHINGGEERDWPLPAVAVHALQQQQELAYLMREWTIASAGGSIAYQSSKGLWTSIKKKSANTDTIDNTYDSYVKKISRVFALEALTGDAPEHAHRYRKTIARLLALAVAGAPKIVMDFFGHRDIEMSLSYILADPLLQGEMEEVIRAQTIMTAVDAFAHADLNGGPAADNLSRALLAEQARLGKYTLGVSDIHELAEAATIGGRAWPLVRKGVVCTKGPQQVGPCAKNRAMAEPSRCRSHCAHRLELHFIREDVDAVIAMSVRNLEECIAKDESMAAEYWIGQICANIYRFGDLRDKWQSNTAVAFALAKGSAENG